MFGSNLTVMGVIFYSVTKSNCIFTFYTTLFDFDILHFTSLKNYLNK